MGLLAVITFNIKQDLLNLFIVLVWFSSLAFIYFGAQCFYSKFIFDEFKRYQLPKFRKLTGYLQLSGSVGLLVGLYYNPLLLLLASTGLCINAIWLCSSIENKR